MEQPAIPLISAATHVREDPALWRRNLSVEMWERARSLLQDDSPAAISACDPASLMVAMADSGVSEVLLYPTLARRFFAARDAQLQQSCFRLYNDWMIDYCRSQHGRLFGIAMLSAYDIEAAVGELERCRQAGLKGAEIWETPDPALPFSSDHYEPLWKAAQTLRFPISLHAIQPSHFTKRGGDGTHADAVGIGIAAISNTVYDLIFYGVMERFPDLNFVLVGQEIGWIPFFFQQLDYYYRRFSKQLTLPLTQAPSEYLRRQVYATFREDRVGIRQLVEHDAANFMWSSEFSEPSEDRGTRADPLAPLTPSQRAQVTHTNAMRLYRI